MNGKTCWAIVLASMSWLFADRFVVSPTPIMQWGLIGLSITLLLREDRLAFRLNGAMTLCITLGMVGALFLMPAHHRAGAILVVLGLLLGRLSRHAVPVAAATAAVGTLLLLQAPVVEIYYAWTARNPVAPGLSPLLAAALGGLGFDTGASNGAVFVASLRNNHEIAITWNHLAALPACLVFTGLLGWVLFVPRSGSLRFLGRAVLLIGTYVVVRFVVVVGLFMTRMLTVPHDSRDVHVELFWLPSIVLLTYLPLSALLARFFRSSDGVVVPERTPGIAWRPVVLGLLVVVGALSWSTLPLAGERKPGRVLIDNAKGDWERADRPYTPDWYGTESGYNYGCLADYLGRHYELSLHQEGELTSETLGEIDVLILKTASEVYSEREQRAIREFVEGGGGLFVLGEHTNVWGSTSHLNPVLRPFNIALRSDCVFDVERKWEQLYWSPEVGRHPAATRVPFYLFAVSCSIDSDWTARSVIRGKGLWTLPATYAVGNFYPQVFDRTSAQFGAFDQLVSTTFGQGRVLVFSDSTTFSNFDLCDPGKLDLLLDSVEWLNHRNAAELARPGGLGLCLLGLAGLLAIGLRGRMSRATLASTVATSTLAFWFGALGCDAITRAVYPRPEPRTPVESIAFDFEHGEFEVPIFGFSQDFANSFETFHLATMRTGAFPRASFDFPEDLGPDELGLVLVPRRPYSAAEVERVRRHVEEGGRLLILDRFDPDGASTVHPLIESFGMKFGAERCDGESIVTSNGVTLCTLVGGNRAYPSRGSVSIEGGTPILFSDRGEPVASYARVGRGLVIAAGFAEIFSNPTLGAHVKVPDEDLRAIYEVEFTLLRALDSRDVEGAFQELEDAYGLY